MEGTKPADLVLVLSDGSRIACHQAVVAGASATLGRLVDGAAGTPGHPVEVRLDGIDSAAATVVLQSLYGSQLTLSPDTVIPIWDAAIKTGVTQVQAVCDQYLQQAVTVENVTAMLTQALNLGQEVVIDTLIQWAGPRLAEVASTPAFRGCSESVIKRLLLSHKGKEEAVRAAVSWLQSDQAGRGHLSDTLLSALGAQLVQQARPTSSHSQGPGASASVQPSPQLFPATSPRQQQQQQLSPGAGINTALLAGLGHVLHGPHGLILQPTQQGALPAGGGHLHAAHNLLLANASALQAAHVQQQLASLQHQQQQLQLLQGQLIAAAAGQGMPLINLQPGLPLSVAAGGLGLPFNQAGLTLLPQVLPGAQFPGGVVLQPLMPPAHQAAVLAAGASQLPLLTQHLQQQVMALGGGQAPVGVDHMGSLTGVAPLQHHILLPRAATNFPSQAEPGTSRAMSPRQARPARVSHVPSFSRITPTEAITPHMSGRQDPQEGGRRPHTPSSSGVPSSSGRGSQGRQGSAGAARGRGVDMDRPPLDPLSSLAAAAAMASQEAEQRVTGLPPSLTPTPLAAVAVRRKRLREGGGEGAGTQPFLPPVSTPPPTPPPDNAEMTPRSTALPLAHAAPSKTEPATAIAQANGDVRPTASPPEPAVAASSAQKDSHPSMPRAATGLSSAGDVVRVKESHIQEEQDTGGRGRGDGEKRSSISDQCALTITGARGAEDRNVITGGVRHAEVLGIAAGHEAVGPDTSAQSQETDVVVPVPSPAPTPLWPVGPRAALITQESCCSSRTHLGTKVVEVQAPSSKQIAAVLGPEWRTGSGGVLVVEGALADRSDAPLKSKPVVLPQPPKLKGVCHIDSCLADLSHLRDYHVRFRICDAHLKAASVMRQNQPQRFCQQCGRFHGVSDFDGAKRSCRSRLQRHNARRRKKGEEGATGGAEGEEEEQEDDQEEEGPGGACAARNGNHPAHPTWTSCGTFSSTMATHASPFFGPTSSGDQPLMPPGTQFVIAGRGGHTGQMAVVRRWRPLGALPAHRLLACSPSELPLPSGGPTPWCPPHCHRSAPPALPEALLTRVGSIQGVIAAEG